MRKAYVKPDKATSFYVRLACDEGVANFYKKHESFGVPFIYFFKKMHRVRAVTIKMWSKSNEKTGFGGTQVDPPLTPGKIP